MNLLIQIMEGMYPEKMKLRRRYFPLYNINACSILDWYPKKIFRIQIIDFIHEYHFLHCGIFVAIVYNYCQAS